MDIRVIEPDDKLLIVFPADIIPSYDDMICINHAIDEFRGPANSLILSGCDVYVLKDGKQVLLKDELEAVADVKPLSDVNSDYPVRISAKPWWKFW